jgi:hypothetical protein
LLRNLNENKYQRPKKLNPVLSFIPGKLKQLPNMVICRSERRSFLNNKFVYIAAERILHNVVGVMKNAEVMVFLTLIMFAGTFWGFIEAFLFWYFLTFHCL